MSREDIKDMREKIIKGLELSFKRLIISKQRNDEDLIFSRNGEIVKIKAKELIQ